MGRRAALVTTLITGASVASKADAAGLNLMPPALKDLQEGAAKRAGKGDAPAPTSGRSLFEDKLKPPSFSVPKLGPQRKGKKVQAEAEEGDAEEAPAPKPKSKMSMPKFGQKAAKKEEAAAPVAEKPASDAPVKPRKLKQAGMSGKEDERFKSDTVDSLEEKLRKKKSKADEQLQEIKSRVGEKDFDEVPNLNPFGAKK